MLGDPCELVGTQRPWVAQPKRRMTRYLSPLCEVWRKGGEGGKDSETRMRWRRNIFVRSVNHPCGEKFIHSIMHSHSSIHPFNRSLIYSTSLPSIHTAMFSADGPSINSFVHLLVLKQGIQSTSVQPVQSPARNHCQSVENDQTTSNCHCISSKWGAKSRMTSRKTQTRLDSNVRMFSEVQKTDTVSNPCP